MILTVPVITGCVSSGSAEVTETAAEEQSEKAENTPETGGWTAREADNPDLEEAFAVTAAWFSDNHSLLEGKGLPASWTPTILLDRNNSIAEAVLKGGAVQIVSGLNIKLDIEIKGDDPGEVSVFLYRNLSGTYSVWKIEKEGSPLYSDS